MEIKDLILALKLDIFENMSAIIFTQKLQNLWKMAHAILSVYRLKF